MLRTYLKDNYKLTAKEIEILLCVTKGYTNTEIAKLHDVSTHTIKVHISSLLKKFEVKERVSLAVKAVRQCLLNNIEI